MKYLHLPQVTTDKLTDNVDCMSNVRPGHSEVHKAAYKMPIASGIPQEEYHH